MLSSLTSSNAQTTKPVDFSYNPMYEKTFRFYDQSLIEAIKDEDTTCYEFFRLLALCHTVMPDEKNGDVVSCETFKLVLN